MAAVGERLRNEQVPRSQELCAAVAGKHAAWWGFAVYVVFWLFIAGTVGAAFLAAALSEMFSYWKYTRHADSLWAACWSITGAFTIWRLIRWIRWRHAEVRKLARDGVLASAQITEVTSTIALDLFVRRSRNASGVFVYAQVGTTRFRSLVAGSPAWANVGLPVDLVGSPSSSFAFMIAPDGTDFLAKRR